MALSEPRSAPVQWDAAASPPWLSLSGEQPSDAVLQLVAGVGLIRGEYVRRRALGRPNAGPVLDYLRSYLDLVCTAAVGHEVWYRITDALSEELNLHAGTGRTRFERNPVLGTRGAGWARAAPDEFGAECSVVAEVARNHANLRLLVPYVRDETDFVFVRELAHRNGVTCPVGSMIETPSAVRRVKQIVAAGASRLLVGMNDLSCLITASQRDKSGTRMLHPAVWRFVSDAIDAAHSAGRACGVAGNLTSDVIERAFTAGADYVTVHYSHARMLLEAGNVPWAEEDLEGQLARSTRAAIEAYNRDLTLLSIERHAQVEGCDEA
jgi:phosphoenolpyruvate-protein kinase (PTS system EI component)